MIAKCIEDYNTERLHQSLDNEIIEPPEGKGEIVCWELLSGPVEPYRRAA